jgi:hypothetical protein
MRGGQERHEPTARAIKMQRRLKPKRTYTREEKSADYYDCSDDSD